MCACRCGIRVHLRDGRLVYIDGNPNHPVNRGVICAKGASGLQQHASPARLHSPLLRVGKRGSGEFKEISWEEALTLATQWLGNIRQRNPNELAFFTGRDQSQALTGWWAQQFGTVNYAAHGGFCSVNMAAAGMYSIGSAFWEFSEPDWEHTQYFMLWGVAEDHDSNPIKLGLSRLKARGAKIVAINPVRTGYAAIADEWVGIRPGTDGLLIGALIHELLRTDRVDLDYLVRYTNAHWLIIHEPGAANDGLIARDAEGEPLCAVRANQNESKSWRLMRAQTPGISPIIVGEYGLPDGQRAIPAFHLFAQRFLETNEYAPETVSERCGVSAETIRRLAKELATTAFDKAIQLPIPWTDTSGQEHQHMLGRPVAMHAMRGISAHSNGFQTCRMLHLLQMLLGAIDTPGSMRFQPPYPKGIPPIQKPGKYRREDGSLNAAPLGYPITPEDLLVDEKGQPQRIDKAFSWAYPLAVHGMLHTVIRHAHAQDPYPIDTLLLFMANMSWNSAMDTTDTMRMLTDRDVETGEYKIPHIIYSDAYASEMVAYADLILPDTTYLERYDCISMLDRPISDADAAIDGIRQPVFNPDRDVRPFQSVLLELGARLHLPGMTLENGQAKYPDGYPQYLIEHERTPGVGLLMGWRGDGQMVGVGAAHAQQLERYREHGCFFSHPVPESGRYYKMANLDYLNWAKSLGFVAHTKAQVFDFYSEKLQQFRLAGQGHGPIQPPQKDRARVTHYFDPLPFWYEPLQTAMTDKKAYPYTAISQRPMFMYHSWGSQNRWLRQIAARNFLYLHPKTAMSLKLQNDDWVEVQSTLGSIKVQIRHHEGVELGTVWTWNAIGKRRGSWGLNANAPESNQGFLLNHLISDQLSKDGAYANADPITGQAAWYDLAVNLVPCKPPDQQRTQPQFSILRDLGL